MKKLLLILFLFLGFAASAQKKAIVSVHSAYQGTFVIEFEQNGGKMHIQSTVPGELDKSAREQIRMAMGGEDAASKVFAIVNASPQSKDRLKLDLKQHAKLEEQFNGLFSLISTEAEV